MKTPPTPARAGEVAAALRSQARGATLLVGPGQYGPGEGLSRICVLRLEDARRPRLLWDGPLADAEVATLVQALGAFARVWPGELDTMYATPWSLAWTVQPGAFRLYQRWGLRCAVEGEALQLHGRFRRPVLVPRGSIRQVLGWVSEDWVRRGVSLEVTSGPPLVLARHRDWAVGLDVTYDGINLMVDCTWVWRLGRCLAQALGVPYVGNDEAVR